MKSISDDNRTILDGPKKVSLSTDTSDTQELYRKKVFGKKLNEEEMTNILAKPSSRFDSWFQEQSEDAVAGLKDECLHYIRAWGKGGGGSSTEACVTKALDSTDTDIPKVLAVTILEALEMDGESPLEATVLTMSIIDDSLLELGYLQ